MIAHWITDRSVRLFARRGKKTFLKATRTFVEAAQAILQGEPEPAKSVHSINAQL
jgi:hypothetical protein